MRLAAICAIAVGTFVVAASGCAWVVDLDDRGAYPPEAGASVDAGHAAAEGGMSCTSGCCAGVLFVSLGGSNSNDGCSPARPLATIKTAVTQALASTTAAPVREVHVCAGTYTEETLAISSSLVLLGGYNCTTWERTASYGFPVFDVANRTVIRSYGLIASDAATVLVGGSSVLDGFLIQAPPTFAMSAGIKITDGSPMITNNEIFGVSNTKSRGVLVDQAGSPEIAYNLIDGGDGPSGVIGVEIDDCAAKLHDNVIQTGKTSGGTSFGVLGQSGTSKAPGSHRPTIRANTITPRPGITISSTAATPMFNLGAAGIYSDTLGMDIVGNLIVTGVTQCASELCGSEGIGLSDSPSNGQIYNVTGNRIVQTSPNGNGMEMDTVGNATVMNNAVAMAGPAPSSALALTGASKATVVQNTFFARGDILYISGASSAFVANNLFLGDDAPSQANGISIDTCSAVSTFEHNAFLSLVSLATSVGFASLDGGAGDGGADDGGPACSGAASFLTTDTGASGFNGYPDSHGNVHFSSNCQSSEAEDCIDAAACSGVQGSAVACISPFIPSWRLTDSDGGLGESAASSLTSAQGWALAMPVSCTLARGGIDLTASSDGGTPLGANDIDDAGRNTTSPTIGAYEFTGTCTH